MKNPSAWPRLAAAAADARDELRLLVPRLDQAIASGGDATELLRDIRVLAVRHSEGLKAALKSPAGTRQSPRKYDSWRFGSLWDVPEASEGVDPREGQITKIW
jgi:hypothetical protein